eukprot:GFYU01000677.1.p1 GENE.GFYU01000677.1~~GFYU01000677.1.p1  ORF type:complete len:237 (-),score=34.36 GFYU01000677.1:948-1658(-)
MTGTTTLSDNDNNIHLALPKGRMQDNVLNLLEEAGLNIKLDGREYRPQVSFPNMEVKMLKPQNIVEMLHIGSRDVGFAGADWVEEKGVNLVELYDTGLDPVKIVCAVPNETKDLLTVAGGEHPDGRPILIASEYQTITTNWMQKKGLKAELVRTYGATEVFPPEDADAIVDNTATGSTLKANGLFITEVVSHIPHVSSEGLCGVVVVWCYPHSELRMYRVARFEHRAPESTPTLSP